jgi:hypothetical protein
MVDMTHHQFLCRRCARDDRHEKCHIREATAAFSPNEKRIVAFMLRNYTPPTGASAQQNPGSLRQQISLPSVARANSGPQAEPPQRRTSDSVAGPPMDLLDPFD